MGVEPLTDRMEARRQAAGPKIAPSAERIEGRLAAGPIKIIWNLILQHHVSKFIQDFCEDA